MLSLEMLGYYDDTKGSQRYPPLLGSRYPNRGNFIGFVSNLKSRRRLLEVVDAFRAATSFPAEYLVAPSFTVIVGLSDQLAFWRQGYPGLMVTDTAFMRNPAYHLSTDTPDTLDYVRLAQVTEGLIGALRRLASSTG
jgi:hypothetical protein